VCSASPFWLAEFKQMNHLQNNTKPPEGKVVFPGGILEGKSKQHSDVRVVCGRMFLLAVVLLIRDCFYA